MSWNIEIACIQDAETSSLDTFVPDVFVPSNGTLGFEAATSVFRDTDLCVSRMKNWVVVIDTACRFSNAEKFLPEGCAQHDAYVFQISNHPIEIHYQHGGTAV